MYVHYVTLLSRPHWSRLLFLERWTSFGRASLLAQCIQGRSLVLFLDAPRGHLNLPRRVSSNKVCKSETMCKHTKVLPIVPEGNNGRAHPHGR